MNISDRVWWQHTASHVRYGTVKELTERPGVQCDDGEWLYLDADQITPFSEMPDGMYGWVTDADYHSDRSSLSSSGARLLLPPSTPAHFKYRMDNPPKSKPHFDFGHLCHTIVLGKGAELEVLDPLVHGLKKDGTVADNPSATTAWKQAEEQARQSGKLPVHINDVRTAEKMRAEVLNNPVARELFAEGRAEVSLYAVDETGTRLRARADWMKMNGRLTICDYKTAADASPATFGRTAEKWGYHIQQAWYVTVAQLLKLDDSPAFLFVVQEKTPPYLVSVNELDAEAFDVGRRRMREAIATYKSCMETGEWPGYGDDIQSISLPAWAFEDEMEF